MKIIGHRGARGIAPENSLAGFQTALDNHVDEIELDVRLTSDGKAVLCHNAQLTDKTGSVHNVATSTLKELLAIRPALTTLPNALDLINRQVPVIVEIKPGVDPGPAVEIIRSYCDKGWKLSDFSVASFSQAVLLEVRNTLPGIELIVIENWSSWRARHRAQQVGTKRIFMHEAWLWPGFIAAVADNKYQLYTFPAATTQKERAFGHFGLGKACNYPRKAKRWARAGLAGVITDYPDRFKK